MSCETVEQRVRTVSSRSYRGINRVQGVATEAGMQDEQPDEE